MNTDYSNLLTEYPPIISMDQLYKICHVSKRKAKWMLEHGVIPCEDNGNQTRRFAIKLTDVIAFLRNLEQGKVKNLPPPGSFPSKPSAKHINYRKVTHPIQSFLSHPNPPKRHRAAARYGSRTKATTQG